MEMMKNSVELNNKQVYAVCYQYSGYKPVNSFD